MDKSLKVIFINVNSIVSKRKRHNLQYFADTNKPHILLLAEHKLSQKHNFELKGYRTYRQDRTNGRGGGTAICVKEDIKSERISANIGCIEGTIVRVKIQGGNNIVIMALYLRPQDKLNSTDLDTLDSIVGNSGVIIGADLNAKHPSWGGNTTNGSGKVLYEWLLTCPTLVIRRTIGPTRGLSYIDLFMTTIGIVPIGHDPNGQNIKTLDYDSDHRAIEIKLEMNELEQQDLVEIYDYGRLDRRLFNNKLHMGLMTADLPKNRNMSKLELDNAATIIGKSYREAINVAVPKIRPSRGTTLPLPDNIKHLLHQKKRLMRRAHRTKDPFREITLKAEIRMLKKIIEELILKHEDEYYIARLEEIKPSPIMIRSVKRFGGISKRTKIPRLIDQDGQIADDEKGKANILAEKFVNIQLTGATGVRDSEKMAAIKDLKNNNPLMTFSDQEQSDGTINTRPAFSLITPEEIGDALRRLNNKKSSGPDDIPNYVLKRSGEKTWKQLAILFNNCINMGHFPEEWKHSRIVPILKPGKDPTDASGYRPIALISNIGKLFERLILNRMNVHIEEKNVLKDCQFGFRKGLSSTHALMAFSNGVMRGFKQRRSTIAVGLDFEKAFDTVWQEGIIFKMKVIHKFDDYITRLVYDYLMKRTFAVEVESSVSNIMATKAGVPQGSILGPALYNLYLADIPQPKNGEKIYIFADDILVATSHVRAKTAGTKMQKYIGKLEHYFSEWRLKLNVPKCTCMMAKGKKMNLYKNARKYKPQIQIGGDIVANNETMVYLGVKFSENMQFRDHVDMILEKMRKSYALYSRLLSGKRGLSKRVRLLVYKQIVRPIIAYAFPIWFAISSCQMEKIRKAERRILRQCLGLRAIKDERGHWTSPSCKLIYKQSEIAKIKRIDVWMTELAIKFLGRCVDDEGENLLIDECLIEDHEFDNVLQSGGALTPMGLLKLKEKNMLYNHEGNLLFYHRRYGEYNLENTVYNTEQ